MVFYLNGFGLSLQNSDEWRLLKTDRHRGFHAIWANVGKLKFIWAYNLKTDKIGPGTYDRGKSWKKWKFIGA